MPGTQVVILVDRRPAKRDVALADLGRSEFGGDIVWDRSVIDGMRGMPKSPVVGGFLKIARWMAPGNLFAGEITLFSDVDSIFLMEKRSVFKTQTDLLRQAGMLYRNYRRYEENRLTGGNHWASSAYFTQVKDRQEEIRRIGLPESLLRHGSRLRDEHILWYLCESTAIHPQNMPVFSVQSHQTGRFPGIHYGVGRNLRTIDIRLTREDRDILKREIEEDPVFAECLRQYGNLWLQNTLIASGAKIRRLSALRQCAEIGLRGLDLLRRALGRR